MKCSQCLYNFSSTSFPSFTTRLFNLLPPSFSNTSSHTDLSSFLAYAARTNLPKHTTLYQGTHYEYTVRHILRRYAFNLTRLGGRSDLGIDLAGSWHPIAPPLPPSSSSSCPKTTLSISSPYCNDISGVRVVVQCKALKTKITPNIVRELEGTVQRFSTTASLASGSGGGHGNVVGVLVSPREATKGVREALGRSRVPLVWMMVTKDEAGEEGMVGGAKLSQVLWNRGLERVGLGGLGVEVRYSSEGPDGKEIGLTWEGREVPSMDEVEGYMRLLERQWVDKWDEVGVDWSLVSKEEVLDEVGRRFPGMKWNLSQEERREVLESLVSCK